MTNLSATPPPSRVVSLQLVLVRSLLDRAQAAHREADDVGLMMALLLADVAVETVVKHILFDRGTEFGRQDKLGALLDALVDALPSLKLRPELGAARRLREARNPVQHAGQVPSRASVEAHLRDAEGFLTLVVKEFFGVDFTALSAAALVRTEDLRAALAAAAEALRGEHVDEANLLLAAAFQSLSVSVRHWMRRARGVDTRLERFAGVWLNEVVIAVYGPEHPAATMTRLERKPDDHEVLLSVGLALTDVLRLQALGARALSFARSVRTKDPEPLNGDAPAKDDVRAAIDSLARNIKRLEEAQPDLFRTLPGFGSTTS